VSFSLSTLSLVVSRFSLDQYAKVKLNSFFRLFSAFYWIPSAALSAVIIEAVGGLIASPRQTYSYWLVSPLECIIFIAAVLITFFTTIEIGIYVSSLPISLQCQQDVDLPLVFSVRNRRFRCSAPRSSRQTSWIFPRSSPCPPRRQIWRHHCPRCLRPSTSCYPQGHCRSR